MKNNTYPGDYFRDEYPGRKSFRRGADRVHPAERTGGDAGQRPIDQGVVGSFIYGWEWFFTIIFAVEYGDISPGTALGQALAAIVMISGYSIIAVPTGIFTVEFSRAMKKKVTTRVCPQCSTKGHDQDAVFCNRCGAKLTAISK